MKLKTLFLILAISPLAMLAQNDIQSALQKPVVFFSQDNEPLKAVLQSLGRAHGFSIVADEDVDGMVQVEMNNTTVKGVLDAILRPGGYFYEIEEGWISVARFKTILYSFDYPQISRTGTSSSNISLGAQNSGNSGQSGTSSGSTGLGQPTGGSNGGGSSSDTAQISISQKLESDFWQSIEAQIKSMLAKEETFVINKFSGLVQVKAGARTHRDISKFVAEVNDRIGAQVEIVAKIVEVHLSDQNKLGIDWQAAAFSVGNNLHVGDLFSGVQGLNGMLNVKQVGSTTLAADTFSGTIRSGKVNAVITALEEQGDVKVTSQPRLRLLNNSTGYIKDAVDTPFFSKTGRTTITGVTSNINGGTLTQEQWSTQTISIGTVLPVTAQISADNEVTLEITPVISRLRGTEYSPDTEHSQSAPILDVKQTSTIVRVKSGETAIIGGLITDSVSETHRSIPFLGKIPLLGQAFRTDGKVKDRTELVIFLTPTVVSKPGRLESSRVKAPAVAAVVATPAEGTTAP